MNAFGTLPVLRSKREVDRVLQCCEDLVVVLRFGREHECLLMDDVLMKAAPLLARMARIFLVDPGEVPLYTAYFEITLLPATVFFFNAQHMKVDYGAADHTKLVGSLRHVQDMVDLVETVYRAAMHGKVVATCALERGALQQYDLLYTEQ